MRGYIFEEMLGKGSFGEVFRVRSQEDNQIYAIKIIKKELVKRKKL